MQTSELGIATLARLIRERALSPVEVVSAALERMEADRALNAYACTLGDRALDAARKAERELAGGLDHGPLHGLPVAVKDNIDTAGVPTTGGSDVLRGRVPTRDATAWRRLRRGGAILVGKTNLHELAYGAPHPSFGAVHNPYDAARSPGGSSSGSAVAVAAGHVVTALGTDTGGSVRQPAAYCGIVGLKPTPGVIPLDGVLPLAWTLDTVGIMCRDLADTRVSLGAMAGRRLPEVPSDQTRAIRVGIVSSQPGAPIDDVVAAPLREAADRLGQRGVVTEPVSLPPLEEMHAAHRVILAAEAFAAHHASLAERWNEYGPAFREAIAPGGLISAAEYLRAQQARSAFSASIARVLKGFDALLLPATPSVAPPLDTSTGRAAGGAELTRWTFVANFAGLPAVAFPVGRALGLPLGLQVMGKARSESLLLDIAQQALPEVRV